MSRLILIQGLPGTGKTTLATQLSHDFSEPLDVYAPLQVGSIITVDTTHFGDEEYRVLLEKAQKELAYA